MTGPIFRTLLFLIAPLLWSTNVHAQDDKNTGSRNGANPFDVKVQTIRAADLPKPAESTLPRQLARQSKLPTLPSLSALDRANKLVAAQVHRVVVFEKPIVKFQKHPMLYDGHGVWITWGEKSYLVTSHHWVKRAQKIVARKKTDAAGKGVPKASTSTIARTTYGKKRRFDPKEWEEVGVIAADANRDLAVIAIRDDTNGLPLFSVQTTVNARIYGWSPYLNATLTPTLFLPASDAEIELSYYLQVNFLGKLGAPIVDESGAVVGITSLSHPSEPERTLMIPPVAIRVFFENQFPLSEPTERE